MASSLPHPHHTTNNNVETKGGGGLTMILDVFNRRPLSLSEVNPDILVMRPAKKWQ